MTQVISALAVSSNRSLLYASVAIQYAYTSRKMPLSLFSLFRFFFFFFPLPLAFNVISICVVEHVEPHVASICMAIEPCPETPAAALPVSVFSCTLGESSSLSVFQCPPVPPARIIIFTDMFIRAHINPHTHCTGLLSLLVTYTHSRTRTGTSIRCTRSLSLSHTYTHIHTRARARTHTFYFTPVLAQVSSWFSSHLI